SHRSIRELSVLSDNDEPGDKIPPPANKGDVKILDIHEMMGLNGRKGDKHWLELWASICDLLIQLKINVATPWKGQDKTRLTLIYHTKERQKQKKEEQKEREREGRERRKEEKERAKEKASASKAKERQECERKQEEQEEREREREEREHEKREEREREEREECEREEREEREDVATEEREEREREKREGDKVMAHEAAKTEAKAKVWEAAEKAKAAGSKHQSNATTERNAARAPALSAPVPSQGKPWPRPRPLPPPSDMPPDDAEASTSPDKASGSRRDNKLLSCKSSGAGPATPACPPTPTAPNQTPSPQTRQKLATAAAIATAKCTTEDKAMTQTTKPPVKKCKGRMSWTTKKGGCKVKGKGKVATKEDDTGSSDLTDPENDNSEEGFSK
ncbi:hypothetical protein FRC10_002103, partial [Ceratobasidium sp. 414]